SAPLLPAPLSCGGLAAVPGRGARKPKPPTAEVQERHHRLQHQLGARDAIELLLVGRAQLLLAVLMSRRVGLRARRGALVRPLGAPTLTSCAYVCPGSSTACARASPR